MKDTCHEYQYDIIAFSNWSHLFLSIQTLNVAGLSWYRLFQGLQPFL